MINFDSVRLVSVRLCLVRLSSLGSTWIALTRFGSTLARFSFSWFGPTRFKMFISVHLGSVQLGLVQLDSMLFSSTRSTGILVLYF